MTRLIDPHLQKLSFLMEKMGSMALESINLAIDSYLERKDAVQEAHKLSQEILSLYDEVGDLTFDMILRYQPMASDFRLIRSCLEVSYGFTRFGRYAYDITKVRDMFGDISECKNEVIYTLSGEIKHMINMAVQSFATLDLEKARQLRTDEDLVDKYYSKHLPMLINSSNVKCALADALVLRYLERIADHAAFMGESVNYIVTGQRRFH
ncbi:MAG TPA: PhoU domain-containing protein [Candidatus Nitrosotalea sp.]|nr:PhoU domain-containing protein [Candidatus Nitrosotalea sp.]